MLKVKALVERWDCNKERKEEKEGQIWREKKNTGGCNICGRRQNPDCDEEKGMWGKKGSRKGQR